MKKTLIVAMITVMVLTAAGLAQASTSLQKQVAIDAGLAYLATTQQPGGYWNYSGYEAASTAAVLLAFTEQKYKPLGWNGHDYSAVVTNATNYLLSQASTLPFASGGNWWGFGAGSYGIQWYGAGEQTYTSGLAIPALSRLVTNPYGGMPLISPSTTLSGFSGSAAVLNGLTYAQVIQKAVDGFTYYQTGDPSLTYGNRYGGWRYYSNENDSDMSTTQWPIISYLFAQQVPGVTIPDGTVKTALKAWLTADQYTSGANKGGSDYQPGYGIINDTHAGAFLLSNYFAGGGGNGGNGKADALVWLNGDWKTTANGGWWGNEGNPYAMWAVYKALETLYGTTGASPITNLNMQTTPIDPTAVWNWWEDYCQYLCGTQNLDGSWSGYFEWVGPLATAWDINILNATATVPPPPAPIPGSLVLLSSGLLGLGVLRKRMKK